MLKFILALVFLLSFSVLSVEADKNVEQIFKSKMMSLVENNYKAYVENSTADFSKITPQHFEKANVKWGSRLKKGYEATYLNVLKQDGYSVYLWKVSFKDGLDDSLVRVVMDHNGRIAGLWFQ